MLWNAESPAKVQGVHAAYRTAGCDFATTNSFNGTTSVLDRHGLAGRADELNRAAARLAREALGPEGWVLGDIGPFGGFLEPLGETTETELEEIFARQIAALAEGGANAILVETMSDPVEAAVGVRAALRAAPGLPVIVTYAFQMAGSEFRTMMGTTVQEAVSAALEAGAAVVGTNCGTSLALDDYVRLTRALVAAAGAAPVIVQPNAGAPRLVGVEAVYDATPDQMAATARLLLDEGARIVGGCCGTTPDHLAAMARTIREAAG